MNKCSSKSDLFEYVLPLWIRVDLGVMPIKVQLQIQSRFRTGAAPSNAV